MKKKLITLALSLLMVASLTCCNDDEGKILTKTDVSQYIQIGDCKGLTVNATQYELYDSDYKDAVDELFRSQCEPVAIKKGNVKTGDWICIDYVGTVDGIAFGGGSENGRLLQVGSDSLVKGFDEALSGMEVGEEKDVDIVIPNDYWSTEYAGKDAVFSVRINYIVPEITDENVAGLNSEDYSNVAELEEFVANKLNNQLADENKSSAIRSIKDNISQNAVYGKFSDEMIAYQKEIIESQIADILADFSEQLDAATYFQYAYNVSYSDVVDESLKSRLLVLAIAQKEGITVSDSELNKMLKENAEEKGISTKEVLKDYNNDKEYFREYLITVKVNDFLYENNVVETLD